VTTSTIDLTVALRMLADHIDQHDLVTATSYVEVRAFSGEVHILTTEDAPGLLRWLSTVDVDRVKADPVGLNYHVEVKAHVGSLLLELAHVCRPKLAQAIHSAGMAAGGVLPEGGELLALVRAAVTA
jgi:hypothetical protein